MKAKWLIAAALIASPGAALAATPSDADVAPPIHVTVRTIGGIPPQLDDAQRAGYTQVFASIQSGAWSDAQIELDAMKPGPLHAIARAELYTAKGSPKIDLASLVTLLGQAP